MLDQQKHSLSTPRTGLYRLRRRTARQPVRGEKISGCAGRHGFWTTATHLGHDTEIVLCCALTTLEQSPPMPISVLDAASRIKFHVIAL